MASVVTEPVQAGPESGPADHAPVAPTPGGGFAGLSPQFWQALEKEPFAYDLFNTLRWINARAGALAPLGRDTVA
ncbi:type VI secretion system baseplate subunit TssG, partial [Bordetella petrii]|nr:type VI secretion system baseplate subunit TssG [Bordetella petrii]